MSRSSGSLPSKTISFSSRNILAVSASRLEIEAFVLVNFSTSDSVYFFLVDSDFFLPTPLPLFLPPLSPPSEEEEEEEDDDDEDDDLKDEELSPLSSS